MISPSEILTEVIKEESKKIKHSFKGNSYFAVQNIIRRLDVVSLFYTANKEGRSEEEVLENRGFFDFGWAQALKPFYAELDFNTIQVFPEISKRDIDWADYVILLSGKLGFCRQILDYEKSGTLELKNPAKNEFVFTYNRDHIGIEHFDRASVDFYRDKIVEKIIEES